MTTIAYKDGVLAADSLATFGSATFKETKITRLPDGTVVAIAGEGSAGNRFLEWLMGEGEEMPEQQDFAALRVTADGVLVYTGEYTTAALTTDPVAIGSGGNFAIAGMHLGMTAAEAVQLATEIDPNSGGPVCVAEYEEPEEEPEETLIWQKLKTYMTSLF